MWHVGRYVRTPSNTPMILVVLVKWWSLSLSKGEESRQLWQRWRLRFTARFCTKMYGVEENQCLILRGLQLPRELPSGCKDTSFDYNGIPCCGAKSLFSNFAICPVHRLVCYTAYSMPLKQVQVLVAILYNSNESNITQVKDIEYHS